MDNKLYFIEFLGECLWCVSLIIHGFGSIEWAYAIIMIHILIGQYVKYIKLKKKLNNL